MLSAGSKGEKQDRGGSSAVSTAVSWKYLDALHKLENKVNCLFIRLGKIKKNVISSGIASRPASCSPVRLRAVYTDANVTEQAGWPKRSNISQGVFFQLGPAIPAHPDDYRCWLGINHCSLPASTLKET